MRKKKVIWIRQKQKDDGMIWYVCKNSLGEDTIISDMKDVRVNDSSNQGTFFISFNGDMVQTKYGIRSFKYLSLGGFARRSRSIKSGGI